MTRPAKHRNTRSTKRERRRLKVRFWWNDFDAVGFTRDVSNTGLMIETPKSMDIGSRLHIEVFLHDHSHFAEAIVVRQQRYPQHARSVFKPGVGVRFISLSEAIHEISSRGPETLARLLPLEVDLRDPVRLAEIYQRDIAFGALLVKTTDLRDVDTEVVVPILLPKPHPPIDCRAVVVKVDEDAQTMALQLSEPEPVRARLLEIIGSD